MVNVLLYHNSAEMNRVDKTSFLSNPAFTVQGIWREETSILTPEILVENWSSETFNFNYCYIPFFERYYYINDVIVEANALHRLILSVDVLMSFKTQLLATRCFVSRNEYDFTNLLPDNKLPIISGNSMFKFVSTNGDDLLRTYQFLTPDRTAELTTLCVAVQIAGRLPDAQSAPPIPLWWAQFYPSNINTFNMTYLMSIESFAELLAYIARADFLTNLNWLFENPADAIVSFKVIPVHITTSNFQNYFISDKQCVFDTNEVYIGGNATKVTLSNHFIQINNSIPLETIIGEFNLKLINDSDRLAFMRYSPYCDCQLYLPYYGFTDIDVNLYTKADGTFTLRIKYLIDIASGICSVLLQRLDTLNNWLTVQTIEFDISLDSPIGQTNKAEVSRNQLLNSLKIGSSMIKTVAKFSSMSNELAIDKSVASSSEVAAKSFEINREEYKSKSIEMFANNASDYTVSTVLAGQLKYEGGKINSSVCKGYDIVTDSENAYSTCALYVKMPRVNTSLLNGYDHLVGRPCQKVDTLSNFYGYTEVCGVHLENFRNAKINELKEIENIIKSGILLPEPPSNN